MTRVAKEGQRSLIQAQRAKWTNQEKAPFIFTPRVPICLSFNRSAEDIPLSSLSGWDPNKTTAKKEELQIVPNEPTKEGTFHMYCTLRVPICLRFNSQRRPPLSSLFGRDPNKTAKRNYKLCQMNQPRKDLFHMYSKIPHSSQFQEVSRGHPSLVSLGEIQIRQQRKRNYKLCQMNQPRKEPYKMYSKIPHLPKFQQSAEAIPF